MVYEMLRPGITIASTLTLAWTLTASAQAGPARPNVIVIMTDDQGSGDLGSYGARDVKTPHLDALAASGARFTNWYSASSVCSPSRAAVLTGRYPVRAGVPWIVQARSGVVALPAEEVTLAEALRPLGYRSAVIGKWHLGTAGESLPNKQGFDRFFGILTGCVDFYSHTHYWTHDVEPGGYPFHDLWRDDKEVWEDGQYLTESITREARSFIAESKTGPFFLWLTYNAPHYPMQAPQKYMDRFPDLPAERRVHAAMMAAVDDGVGEIVALLESLRLRDDTLILFQSDNGATVENRTRFGFHGTNPGNGGSNKPYRGSKFSFFDGGIRVPALLSWPARVKPRQVIDELAIGIDIFPTAVAAAGGTLPEGRTIDGKDILPLATAGARSPHDALFWWEKDQRAVRQGRWKLLLNGVIGPESNKLGPEDQVFLSDLSADPAEKTNLKDEHPEVVEELTRLLRAWEQEVRRK